MFPKYDIGKNGELYVRDIFTKCGFIAEMNNVYELRYDYDLLVDMDGRKFTIEVKFDVLALKYGNLAIEVRNCKSNSPSGIYSTQADIWVHLLTEKDSSVTAYAIPVKKLISFVENTIPLKHTTKSGDQNANLMLYKKDVILPQFTRFDYITDPKVLFNTFANLLNK
jgi:hypothetical protein